ncbi:protein of unknown function [Moraxella cuniculi DSM 21768]|uniref:Tip attachment protein J central straight fiber domain-containing protein n=1 Tax=Moraxella cuniculi DSM 21768 TaxID=1122245 RepID=A0A1N7GBD2_9GAMM|nr:DUF1983 domain-containing protein [Moraxella cuniculi]OOS02165.1 hypothetical protein B0189_10985 [Moraxella cuniculi]SIS09877.1 protein of unknown function [Moraxella cuniculi DSM 21768]
MTARGAITWQAKSFSVAQYDWSSVNNLTISADVKCNNLQRNGDLYRITVEIKAIMSNDAVWWIHATLNAPIASYSGRISKTYNFTDLKIKNVEFANILINNVSSNNDIVISKPKLEVGTIATDWTPAPEDVDSANQAALEQISQVKATADGLSAQHTIKVQTGGIVSGIGLMSSNGVSAFAVRADQFYIAPPTGTSKGVLPFTVQTMPRTVNGVSVPAGTYIDNACIANGSIDIAKINKASIQSLSALSANIGTLTTSDSRGTFTYTGSKIELRDPQGRLLMEMGLL